MTRRCQLCGRPETAKAVIVWGRPCLGCRKFHRACSRCVADFGLADTEIPGVLSSRDDFARCLLPILEELRVARALMGEWPPELSDLVRKLAPYVPLIRPRFRYA